MNVERPSVIGQEWCPDCGEELQFSGTQSAGYAQFFCELCRYRHDTFVGISTVEQVQNREGDASPFGADASSANSD